MAEYKEHFQDKKINLVGTLKAHTWRESVTPQFQVIDAIIVQ